MANFCRDCTIELFGEEAADKNDLRLNGPDYDPLRVHTRLYSESGMTDFYWQLCEHCGPGWFDVTGTREKPLYERKE